MKSNRPEDPERLQDLSSKSTQQALDVKSAPHFQEKSLIKDQKMLQVLPAITTRPHYQPGSPEQLVLDHQPLARKLAWKYAKVWRGDADGPEDIARELTNVAILGLFNAAKKFNPENGSFGGYAGHYARSKILGFFCGNNSIVALSTYDVKKNRETRKDAEAKAKKSGELSNLPDTLDRSFDDPLDEDDNSVGKFIDWLEFNPPVCAAELKQRQESPEAALETRQEALDRQRHVQSGMAALNEREQKIFTARHLLDEPVTLHDLSEQHGVSLERVRQIEVKAYDKFREAVIAKASWWDDAKCSGIRLPSLKADDNRLVNRIRGLPTDLKDKAGNITRHTITGYFGFDTSPRHSDLDEKIKGTQREAKRKSQERAEYRARAIACGLTWAKGGRS